MTHTFIGDIKMIRTQSFSHDLIYDQVQDFCNSRGITKKSFRIGPPNLVTEFNLNTHDSHEEFHAFNVDYGHPEWNRFSIYLNEKYFFESSLVPLLKQYDDFFNHTKEDHCYNSFQYYAIDLSGQLRKVYFFEFFELKFGDFYMSLFEVNNSNIEEFEKKIFEYYLYYFAQVLPDELHKPLSSMSPQELDVVRMICI